MSCFGSGTRHDGNIVSESHPKRVLMMKLKADRSRPTRTDECGATTLSIEYGTKRVRQSSIGIVATVVGALVLCAACTASGLGGTASPPPDTTSPPTTAPRPGASAARISEAAAIAAARSNLPDKSAPVWAAMSGTMENVYATFTRSAGQPVPDTVAADRVVWGVEFKVVSEICGPSGTVCEKRDGLTTVYIDGATGEWLMASGFAPSQRDPLPKP
jgi:hypothetical protein